MDIKNKRNQDLYVNHIKRWLNYVLIILGKDIDHIDEKTMISGKYYDLIINNMINTKIGLKHFDQEWKLKREISLYFLIFRCIYHDIFRNYASYKNTTLLSNTNIISVITNIFKKLHLHIVNETILEKYLPLELEIQSEIN